MQTVVREKLRNDLGNAYEVYTTIAEQLRNIAVQKISQEAEKEVLKQEKVELQKQVDLLGKHVDTSSSTENLMKIVEFWSEVGARTMVENCLCSQELKDWLLTFAAKCIDIGYTEGVAAVFQAKRKDEKAEEFSFYEEENMDGETFVDGKIVALQSSILDFSFFELFKS